MKTIWLFLVRCFSYAWLRLGGYGLWSRLFRFMWERKYLKIELLVFSSLRELADFVGGGGKWRADSWRALFDAISTPQRAQQIFSGAEPVPDSEFDCDEFAIFQASVIKKSLMLGKMLAEKIQNPRFFTVVWMDGWKPNGHNVVLLEHLTDRGIQYSFMDYGMPSELCPDINSVAQLVRKKYGKEGNDAVVWCAATTDLKPWLTHWGSGH